MAIECAYSFEDLYQAAFGRVPAEQELLNLYALPQDERNQIVEEWAAKADWQTKVRMGADRKEYYAFAPKFTGCD